MSDDFHDRMRALKERVAALKERSAGLDRDPLFVEDSARRARAAFVVIDGGTRRSTRSE